MSLPEILVGIDFSPESRLAAHRALGLARATDARLTLVHVMDEVPELPDTPAPTAAEQWRALAKDKLERVRRDLASLREELAPGSTEVSDLLIEGFADTALCDLAAERRAGLVVVGTAGRTGLERFLVGSVAENVVRLSPVSTLVVRDEPPSPRPFERILVATDFTPPAEAAAALARELAAPGAELVIAHCLPRVPRAAEAQALSGTVVDAARDLGERLVSRYGEGLSARYVALDGDPADALIGHLEDDGFDLCVAGSHGRRGLQRLLLGSVAEKLVRYAPCSVAIARFGG